MPQGKAKTHRWRQKGSTYVWRYVDNSRNFPGWHVVLDGFARDSLSELLSAFIEDSQSLHRTISVTRPTERALVIPNNRGGHARYLAPSKIRLEFDPNDPQSWLLESQQDTLVWKIGRKGVEEFAAALNDPQEYFDRSFGGEPGVWLWGILETA